MRIWGFGVFAACAAMACGGGGSSVRPDCPAGQTSLDGTCVSQQIADYVGCIRATGATVASDNSRSLSAAAGAAGVTASTQADVKEKLERRYATVSDANSQEIIHNCYAKTGQGAVATPSAAAEGAEMIIPARSFTRGEGVAVGATQWGANLVTNGPPFTDRPNMVAYEIRLVPGRTYELWGEYAAVESRPAEIRFNGALVTQTGIASVTGSWFERDCKWFREGTVAAKEGTNVLEIRRTSFFSHLKTFKLVPMR